MYYALFPHSCCFCKVGSGANVYTAAHALGPYTFRGNIGCNGLPDSVPAAHVGGSSSPRADREGCGLVSANATSVTHAQQNYVFQVGEQFIWTGDRWKSAPDHLKSHDFQYWAPLSFLPDGSIAHMRWVDEFRLELPQDAPAATSGSSHSSDRSSAGRWATEAATTEVR